MLIGIDASRANRNQRTGVEEYTYQLIQGLKKITPDNVRVVLYTNKKLLGKLGELPKNWTQKVLKWFPRRFWTQIRLSWEMLVHPTDVLFIPAHVFPIIHPKKTIMTVHDIAAIKFPQSYNWFERWYSVWSARAALKKLWRVIVPSEFTKKELRNVERGMGNEDFEEKIKVIQHGYDRRYEKKYDQNTKKILEKYNLEKPYLLSVGRLEQKKNTVNIIKAFENIKMSLRGSRFASADEAISRKLGIATPLTSFGTRNDSLKLVLVGKPGFGYEKIKNAIEASEYKNDIITHGWVDEEDLPCLMSSAEVFVFPSLYEGFGLPVLEAMAAGVPVVASKGVSQEVGGDAVIYVDPMSVEEISESILKIMQNVEFRMQNVNKGIVRVKDFSWEKCAQETLQLLLSS